jgi:hypothetical protein
MTSSKRITSLYRVYSSVVCISETQKFALRARICFLASIPIRYFHWAKSFSKDIPYALLLSWMPNTIKNPKNVIKVVDMAIYRTETLIPRPEITWYLCNRIVHYCIHKILPLDPILGSLNAVITLLPCSFKTLPNISVQVFSILFFHFWSPNLTHVPPTLSFLI